MLLKLIFSTKSLVASEAFELGWIKMGGFDVSPEDCIAGESPGVIAAFPGAF
jgi:hypothetical protein